jgi:hypothetical protein
MKHSELKQKWDESQALLGLLQERTYFEAIAILAHIRRGHLASEILKLVAAGEELLGVARLEKSANVVSCRVLSCTAAVACMGCNVQSRTV